MGQNFFPDTVNQTLLFPPSLHDWLPEGHLARFLVDVVSALDLSAIYGSYAEKDGRGQAAYVPEMMVRLLLYGYATGVYSSRKIQTRTFEDLAFRYLSGDQHPDHATIAEFRKRHLDALSGLFTQALLLCSEAGLVKLGHVSIDGTKIKANARKQLCDLCPCRRRSRRCVANRGSRRARAIRFRASISCRRSGSI